MLDGWPGCRYVLGMSRSCLCICGSVVAALALCSLVTAAEPPPSEADKPVVTEPVGVEKLKVQADLLKPLVQTSLGREFLDAVKSLPRVDARTLYRNREKRQCFSAAAAAKLTQAERGALTEISADEGFYYFTAYGSPLVYVRVLELAAKSGMQDLAGKRVMDFGYGSIGQLRLMASLGAQAVGLDPSEVLRELYSQPSDQGAVPLAASATATATAGRRPGRVTLVHQHWPAEKEAVEAVAGGYDLITSKNTLKNGYLHPARPVDKQMLLHLGVSDAEFVSALFEALKPGGLVVIYNLSPAPARENEPYIPWADGRCPFPREMWERTGFELIAFDVTDDTTAHAIFAALGYPTKTDDGRQDLFSHYTIARRPQ